VHIVKAYEEVEVQHHSFLTSTPSGILEVNFMFRPFTPPPPPHSGRELSGTHRERVGLEKNLLRLLKIGKGFLSWPARSLFTVRTTLSQLKFFQYWLLCKKGKVEQSLYSPGQSQRVPGIWDFQISRQSAYKDGNFRFLWPCIVSKYEERRPTRCNN